MSWLALPLLTLAALLATATPAEAQPLFAVVGALVSAASAAWAAIGTGALATAVKQTVLGLALSKISQMIRGTPPPPGVRRRVDFGGDRPQRVIVGWYATPGQLLWEGSHGQAGKAPNAYYNNVILLSVLPVQGLTGVQINGAAVELGDTPHPDYGLPVLDYREGNTDHLWVKFLDGRQTSADPMLVAKYGEDEEFAWTDDMIGRGCAYAIVTTRGNHELWGGQPPSALFEIEGISVYDQRLDGTAGGSGPQRLDNPATWAHSLNPIAVAHTILTAGLSWEGQHLYGPRWPRWMMPAANVAAALNACDVPAEDLDGNPEPSYRIGAELDLSMEPRAFIAEVFKSCNADTALCEGRFLIHVGPASAPVAYFTDTDCSISDPQELDPFKDLQEAFNAAAATFPDPEQGWVDAPAPARYHPEWEEADGGRRVVHMPFPLVPWVSQVQRLEESKLADQRRGRVHRVVLSPPFGHLSPLDYVAWSSTRNHYSLKLFKVVSVRDHLNGFVEVLLLEEDPDDYDPPALLPHSPVRPSRPQIPPQAVPGFNAFPHVELDGDGNPRRGGARIIWDPDGAEDANAVLIRCRAGGDVGNGWTIRMAEIGAGETLVFDGLIGGEPFQFRARLGGPARPLQWTDWITVEVPFVGVSELDLSSGVKGSIAAAQRDAADALEAVGVVQGNLDDTAQTLRQDFEAADVLLSRSIVDLNTARLGDNLIPNGMFLGGDLAQWSDVAPTFSVIERGPGHGAAAVLTAPYAHILSIQQRATGADGTALFESPVQPGEQFQGSFLYATGGGQRDATLQMRFQFRDVEGAIVPSGSSIVRAVGNVSNIAWAATDFAPVVAPAGAATLTIIIRRNGGGAGEAYLAAIKCDRLDGAAAAAISAEASIREGADQIMAGQIGSLTTRMGTAEGNITVAQQTATSASQAISAIDTTVTAEYGTWEAMATQTAAAVATANTVQAQQRLGVVAGAQGASLELLAWDGAAGSGNAVVLSTDMLLIQDGTGNLVIDGGTWRSGDGRGIPEGSAFEVWPRGPVSGNPPTQTAPTPFFLVTPGAHSSSSDIVPLFAPIPVRAGDTFAWSMDIAVAGNPANRNARWQLVLRWYGADGTNSSNTVNEITTSDIWDTRTGTFAAPRDGELVVELCRVGNAANPQNGRGYTTNLDIRKQVSGVTAITPNSVTADLVNAGSFQAAGLAVFGGTLQSADYSAGSTGWRIQNNGNAEFNNLVARGWLQVGSVSDIEQVFMPNEYIRDSAGWAVAATITLGNMSPTDMWFVHASASYRRLFGETLGAGKDAEWAPGYVGSRMRVRRRVQVDGVWEAWGQLAFFEVGYLQDTTWQPIMFNETIAGDHTNVQYRIETERGVGQFRNPSATNFRRIALVGRRVMR